MEMKWANAPFVEKIERADQEEGKKLERSRFGYWKNVLVPAPESSESTAMHYSLTSLGFTF